LAGGCECSFRQYWCPWGGCHSEPFACHSERSEESRSDCFFYLRPSRAALSSAPGGAQVLPITIRRSNQRNLLLAASTFDLLLTSQGGHDITACLDVHQPVDVVPCRKPRQQLASVLQDATLQVACHPRTERARFAGHDVDVVGLQRGTPVPSGPIQLGARNARARFLAALGMTDNFVGMTSAPMAPPVGPTGESRLRAYCRPVVRCGGPSSRARRTAPRDFGRRLRCSPPCF